MTGSTRWRRGWSADPAAETAFLDKLENDAALHDADKLAFRDPLTELSRLAAR